MHYWSVLLIAVLPPCPAPFPFSIVCCCRCIWRVLVGNAKKKHAFWLRAPHVSICFLDFSYFRLRNSVAPAMVTKNIKKCSWCDFSGLILTAVSSQPVPAGWAAFGIPSRCWEFWDSERSDSVQSLGETVCRAQVPVEWWSSLSLSSSLYLLIMVLIWSNMYSRRGWQAA